jgi:hypothetical protein
VRRASSLPARRAVVCIGAAAALVLAGSPRAATTPRLDPPLVAELAQASFAGARLTTASGASALRPAYWGGPYTTPTGETVRVLASDAYPVDETRTQGWANYVSSLVHGTELASLSLYLAPPDEVQSVCGRGALACYSPTEGSIVAPGDNPTVELSSEAIVAHEYGHHVAANRSNPPWAAVDWGTKRWASYVGVCAQTEAGEVFPGDERENYRLNPGEGFAEAYRVLNETRLGVAASPWTIVDDLFIPDAPALELIAQDVTQPWTARTVFEAKGRLSSTSTRARNVRMATPLDGNLRVTLRAPAKSSFTIALVDAKTGEQLARAATATAPRAARIDTTVCGQRTLTARITAVKGSGTYRMTIARP